MTIAGSTEELLWNVSHQARWETGLTRNYVKEMHTDFTVTAATEHEETTTGNLLRHLAYYGQQVGVLAVQHTKRLEGGYQRKGRQVHVPSGADLELAVEIGPGLWLNLLLQAKALKVSKSSATYSRWSPSQNQKLIDWANAHGRVPGMLLYNDLFPPFVSLAPPQHFPDYACTAFGACPSVSRTQLGAWGTNSHCVGPAMTPVGISMCLDEALMLAAKASPSLLRDFHFQIEHLLHDDEHGLAVDSTGRTLGGLATPNPPDWAARLLAARDAPAPEVLDVDRPDIDDRPVEAAARVSVVMPFFDGR
ncbi:hypothetical protein [Aeromicrobium fastidiosum]|uniref:Uncharacterized protein n=1 Tax=Aeromicrobium fastidiosum TaxID=52699 RepID=A0A641ALS3_9ACTN|nr:hypothetical protein [Aeromicrobium fastidiosum]KAA1376343.1 hypothetical protein ESP62_012985 [Aeromicrobium fastidiosum]MBP2391757.1 hypothetical protein [Aeromicrobium fastidiosum]